MKDLALVTLLCAPFVAALVMHSERGRRWICKNFGHAWLHETRAEPVIPLFAICARCGKWSRVALREELR